MLIPYNTPITHPDAGISITDFTLVTTLAGLKDGRPGGLTVLAWPAGTQTTSTTAVIDVSFPAPITPRVAGVVGIQGLPAGLKCTIGWATSDGGTADQHVQESTVIETIVGDLMVYDTWDAGIGPVYGVRFTFFNSLDSATTLAAEDEVTIGELWASGALEIDAETDGDLGTAGGTITQLSISGQPFDSISLPRRTLRVPVDWAYPDKALFDAGSVEAVRNALASAPRTLITPYETPIADARKGAFYARYLTSSQRGLPRSARQWQSEWQFEELR